MLRSCTTSRLASHRSSSPPVQGARLDDLTLPTTRVHFEINGFDDHRAGTWLQSTTCILVWDPDGKLTGTEIGGIVVWRDANGNGASDPGEVIPAEQFGIVEIAVRGRGITLRDGTVLPMFDWIPQGSHKRPH